MDTFAWTKGVVSFAEVNEISIGPKAVRLQWPVLPDCCRSVELAEITIVICTFGALTALPDHLQTLSRFSSVEGLLSAGPTPSSFSLVEALDFVKDFWNVEKSHCEPSNFFYVFMCIKVHFFCWFKNFLGFKMLSKNSQDFILCHITLPLEAIMKLVQWQYISKINTNLSLLMVSAPTNLPIIDPL